MDDYGDDDDLGDYGEYYAEDSDGDQEPQFVGGAAGNYPPGAMFQGPKMGGMGGGMGGGMPPAGYGQVNSASGVPFYGQTNKTSPPMGYGAAS